jgi:hypothetical protein
MGRNWNARVVLPSRSASLIGVRETILESLARLARGLEGRIEWPIANGCCAGGARPGVPLPVLAEAFLLVMCIRRGGSS